MCGIVGLFLANKKSHVNQALVDGLTILQHRGQDACGIVTVSQNRLHLLKNSGKVAEVFTQENIVDAIGNIGIGHVRYPTSGGDKASEAQPLYTNCPFGIAISHNGNLINTLALAGEMRANNRHINTDSDSEVLLNVFANELQHYDNTSISPSKIFDAVEQVMSKCKGAYATVMLINQVGLLAFRDPNGIRPLCFGTRCCAEGTDYALASESVAIDALDHHFNFKLERDVRAGEAIFIASDGSFHSKRVCSATFTPCLFEYVYFARPDSILDGVQVYEARRRMGEKLAARILSEFSSCTSTSDQQKLTEQHDIDVVIPIPETSRTAALQCAQILRRPYCEGLVKNRYIARTFIMPGQEMRRKTVRLKLNSILSAFFDKTVLLVDDSIVRGTTAVELVQMAVDAGAKKVYFASAAPPVRHINVYGIDIPTRGELVAHHRTETEIQQAISADRVFFNTLEDTEEAVRGLNPTALTTFESSCFNGQYITPDATLSYLESVEAERGMGRTGVNTHDCVERCDERGSKSKQQRTSGSTSSCESIHNML